MNVLMQSEQCEYAPFASMHVRRYELTASEFPQRLTACRLLRGPKPEDGEQGGAGASTGAAAGGEAGAAAATMPKAGAAGGDKAAADAELAEFTAAVDEGWAKRITEGDPLEARCLRKKVGKEGTVREKKHACTGCGQSNGHRVCCSGADRGLSCRCELNNRS